MSRVCAFIKKRGVKVYIMCNFDEQSLFLWLQFYLSFIDIGIVCKLIHVWSPSGKNKILATLCMKEKLSRKESSGQVQHALKKLFGSNSGWTFRNVLIEELEKLMLVCTPTSPSHNVKDSIRCVVTLMNWKILNVTCMWMKDLISHICVMNKMKGKNEEDIKEETGCCRMLLEHSCEYFQHIHALPSKPMAPTRRILLGQIVLLAYFADKEEKKLSEFYKFQDMGLKDLFSLEFSWMKEAYKRNLIMNQIQESSNKSFKENWKNITGEMPPKDEYSTFETFLWNAFYGY